MTDDNNTEMLNLFRDALQTALDTDLVAKVNQVHQNAEADIKALKAKVLSEKQARSNTAYHNFVLEVQRQRIRSTSQEFADRCLREVRRYAESHTLADVTFKECQSGAMKLFYRFIRWQVLGLKASHASR
jgi:hypothetical protein